MRSYTLSKQYREFSARFSEKQGALKKVPSGILARTCRKIKNAAGFAGFLEISDMAQVLEYGFANAAKTAKKDEKAFRFLLIKAYRLLLKTMPKPPGKIPKAFKELFARLKPKLPGEWRIQRDVDRLLVTNDVCRIPRKFYEEALDRDLHLVLVAFDPERTERNVEDLTSLADRLAEAGVLLRHGPLLQENVSAPESHYFLLACGEKPEDLVAREHIPGSILRTIYSPGGPERGAGAKPPAYQEETFLTESFRGEEEEIELPDEPPEAMPTSEEELEALTDKGDSRKKKPDGRVSSRRHVRFTIGFKLIFIISAILVLSLSGMIFLASYFFLEDSTVRVEENNHTISRITGLKVEADFLSFTEKARLLLSLVSAKATSEREREKLAELFFSENEDILYTGVPGKAEFFNEKAMAALALGKADLQAALASQAESLESVKAGETLAVNLTPVLKRPVLGLGLPFREGGRQDALAVVVSIEKALRTVKGSGIARTFVVNGRGELILHPDADLLAGKVDYRDLPIVAMMMKSPIDNGQTQYPDADGRTYLGSFKRTAFGNIGVVTVVPAEKAFEAVKNIQRRNLYIMLAVLSLAVMVVYFFAKTITTPVKALMGAALRVEEGKFILDMKPTSRDELGALTETFVEMGRGLAEREKIKDAFGKFVNKEIAEKVLKDEISLGGERKEATIFFSDIRSFTAISEKLQPEEVVDFLNQYMTRMVNCVNSTGGVVDKFIGDAIMAVWGVPVSSGRDAQDAVDGALMMRKSLAEFNQGRGSDKKPLIRIGCGINSGPVVAGQIGSTERMEYTVIGDAVNLASRIEALNKPFGTDILVSEDTLKELGDGYVVEPMEAIKVKGKRDPQKIFAVLGRKDDPDAPGSLDELRRRIGIDPASFKRGSVDEEEKKYEILSAKKGTGKA